MSPPRLPLLPEIIATSPPLGPWRLSPPRNCSVALRSELLVPTATVTSPARFPEPEVSVTEPASLSGAEPDPTSTAPELPALACPDTTETEPDDDPRATGEALCNNTEPGLEEVEAAAPLCSTKLPAVPASPRALPAPTNTSPAAAASSAVE